MLFCSSYHTSSFNINQATSGKRNVCVCDCNRSLVMTVQCNIQYLVMQTLDSSYPERMCQCVSSAVSCSGKYCMWV